MNYSIDYNKYKNKYRLRIKVNGKNKHIGYFETKLEAEEVAKCGC